MAKFKKVYCKNCNKIIYRPTGRFNENMKLGHNFYCSRRCEFKFKTKKQKLLCENCGKSFLRQLSQISLHNYCSQSCGAIANNKKYPKRHSEPKFKTCKECGRKYRKDTNNKKYCSIECRRKAEQWRKQDLIKIIRATAKKLKRVPARRELRISDPCRKIFGSWNNAVITAGFEPNRSHDNRMYKRVGTRASDGHLCDSISEALVDNWLTKNNIIHKKDVPYPTTNHKADWAIDLGKKTIFVEYFGLANDSPRYDRAITKKKELCKKLKLNLIEIYPKDLYPTKNLDIKLKAKFKSLINK